MKKYAVIIGVLFCLSVGLDKLIAYKKKGRNRQALILKSNSWSDGYVIPKKFICDGESVFLYY